MLLTVVVVLRRIEVAGGLAAVDVADVEEGDLRPDSIAVVLLVVAVVLPGQPSRSRRHCNIITP